MNKRELVSAKEINSYRASYGLSINEAKKRLTKEKLKRSVRKCQRVDDLKLVMLQIIENV